MKKKNRVYYGEYTLKHWIDLMLRMNITLPPYQRKFVWDKERSTKLIQSIANGEFVPPVTIGCFVGEDGRLQNYIIDGQQRLTSILLAYLKAYPIVEKFKCEPDLFIDEADDIDDEEPQGEEVPAPEEHKEQALLDWRYSMIVKDIVHDVQKVRDELSADEKYETFNQPTRDYDTFFDENYLGFALLIPDNLEGNQQKYYSQVFKNINMRGFPLENIEVRQAQYFLDPDLAQFFDPEWSKEYHVSTKHNSRLDFVKYLAFCFRYIEAGKKMYNVAKNVKTTGQKANIEDFYSLFISDVMKQKRETAETTFSKSFPDKDFKSRLQKLSDSIAALSMHKTYDTVTAIDYYFFGLVYHVMFEGKELDETKYADIKRDIDSAISTKMSDKNYSKSPNVISRIRNRVLDSIEIYSRYVK